MPTGIKWRDEHPHRSPAPRNQGALDTFGIPNMHAPPPFERQPRSTFFLDEEELDTALVHWARGNGVPVVSIEDALLRAPDSTS
jgi:hypothetical protein